MSSTTLLFGSLILAVCLTQLASDIYAPSLLAIAQDLNTTVNLAQWSMAIYMVAVAMTQLIYGVLSEGVGRKIPIVIGLFIMFAGSIVCSMASTITTLIIGRCIQGCGAGACAALWRAIFRDKFTGDQLAKFSSYLVILIIFIVPAAPALGGLLQTYFTWHANFIFMSVYALITLLVILFALTETSQHHHPERLRFAFITTTYMQLLTSRLFMGITACTFLCYGVLFAWLVTAPVLFIQVLHYSPAQLGWILCLSSGVATGLSAWVNSKVVIHVGTTNMLRLAFGLVFLSGLILFFGNLFWGMSAVAIIVPVMLFNFGVTLVWPNAFANALSPFGNIAGYASALYSFMQMMGAGLIGGLISYMHTKNQISLSVLMMLASMLSISMFERVVLPALSQYKIKEPPHA